MDVDAVVVAAGRSERFGEDDKLMADLNGRPVLAWSLAALTRAACVRTIVVVTQEEAKARMAAQAAGVDAERLLVVPGGARRRDSVEAGLEKCTTEYVLIHDGARPFVTVELVERCVAAAVGVAGATVAVPVTDSIKVVNEEGTVVEHPDRHRLWAAQTPQVVRRDLWLAAAAADPSDATDDVAMVARLGYWCRVVEGDRTNLKITFPLDLMVARAIAAWHRDAKR